MPNTITMTAAGTKVQKFYFALGQTTPALHQAQRGASVAVRTIQNNTDTLQWILSDQLGSATTTANADGTWNSTIQYTAFGEIRLTKGITSTKYRYTGQLAQAELGLDYYVARWYDPVTGHFTQADTIVPNPGKSSSYDRYAYVSNDPIRYNDPSGHDGELPYSDLLQQAIDFFSLAENGGWSVVGNPLVKSQFANGSDMVFIREMEKETIEVLSVEIKDLTRNVTISTLGYSEKWQDWGGSIVRSLRSAERFKTSSNPQLGLESRTLLNNPNNLKNALFTNAKVVSEEVMNQFNGVYTNAREKINIIKPIIVSSSARSISSFSSMIGKLIYAPIVVVPLRIIIASPYKSKKEIGLQKMERFERRRI